MYGTLRGALAGRKIEFDRDSYKATVEGRIKGIGKTIRITAIHVHYDLTVPAEARKATERALEAHPQGCPAHSERQGRHHHQLVRPRPSRCAGVGTPRSCAPRDVGVRVRRRTRWDGPVRDSVGALSIELASTPADEVNGEGQLFDFGIAGAIWSPSPNVSRNISLESQSLRLKLPRGARGS